MHLLKVEGGCSRMAELSPTAARTTCGPTPTAVILPTTVSLRVVLQRERDTAFPCAFRCHSGNEWCLRVPARRTCGPTPTARATSTSCTPTRTRCYPGAPPLELCTRPLYVRRPSERCIRPLCVVVPRSCTHGRCMDGGHDGKLWPTSPILCFPVLAPLVPPPFPPPAHGAKDSTHITRIAHRLRLGTLHS